MPRFTLTLVLSEEQERQLEQWLAALGTPQQVALRCRIVLACAAGKPEIAIAAENRVNRKTVRLCGESGSRPKAYRRFGRLLRVGGGRPLTGQRRSSR